MVSCLMHYTFLQQRNLPKVYILSCRIENAYVPHVSFKIYECLLINSVCNIILQGISYIYPSQRLV